jgi:hypothetical protein
MSDPCCPLCKGAHGICLSRFQCNHHIEADKQDDANHRARQLYYNPTADEAIANVTRERKRK